MSIFNRLNPWHNESQKDFSNAVDAYAATANANNGNPDKSTAALYHAYTQAIANDKKNALKDIEDHYITRAVINLVTADVLETLPFRDILSYTSPDKKINTALVAFQHNNDMDQLVSDILPQLLFDGNYHIRVTPREVEDDIPLDKYVTAYKSQRVHSHLTSKGNKIDSAKSNTIAHFGLRMKRTRIDLDQKKSAKSLPSVIRHGASLFYDSVEEIANLHLADTVKNAANASAAAEGTLIGINVPATQKPDAVLRVMNRYEQMLNKTKLAHNASGRLTASDVISRMGIIRAIPLFGDGKGQLTKMEASNSTQDLTELRESVRDQRKVVLSILGIPFELLYSYEGTTETASVLKRYGRYVRLINSVRKSLTDGVQQILLAYLSQNSIEATPSDIHVTFIKPTADLSMLDRLELVAGSLQSVQDLDGYLRDLMNDDSLEGFITNDMRARVLSEGLSLLLGERVTPPKKISTKTPAPNSESLYPEIHMEEFKHEYQ